MTTDARLTAKDAAEMAVKYKALKEAESTVKGELEPLADALREYINETGEPLSVEGQPDLKLMPRDGAPSWDIEGFAANEPQEFERALSKGGLSGNLKVLQALESAGQITGAYKRFMERGQTWALVFGKEKR